MGWPVISAMRARSLSRCSTVSSASSAVAAMIRSGIEGARCWPRWPAERSPLPHGLQPVFAFEDDVEDGPGDDHDGDGGGEAYLPAEAWVGHVHPVKAGNESRDRDDRGPARDLLGDDVQPVALDGQVGLQDAVHQ